jgi:hypothetical protein
MSNSQYQQARAFEMPTVLSKLNRQLYAANANVASPSARFKDESPLAFGPLLSSLDCSVCEETLCTDNL